MDKSHIKIVVVEDDVMLAEIYQTRIGLIGYTCVVANDGLSGLNLIKNEQPDLILLDLMLPLMSGEDILIAMRGSEWGKELKVLMLTNISEAEAPEGIRSHGIEGYIVKANLSHDDLDKIVIKIVEPALLA